MKKKNMAKKRAMNKERRIKMAMSEKPTAPSPQETSAPHSLPDSFDAEYVLTRSVSTKRMEELLFAARKDRLTWIGAASCPYRHSGIAKRTKSKQYRHSGNSSILKSLAAHGSLKNAVDILEEIYEIEEQADKENGLTVSDTHGTNRQIRKTGDLSEDDEFGLIYSDFIQKIQLPECHRFVKTMKSFVCSFEDKASEAKKRLEKLIFQKKSKKKFGQADTCVDDEFSLLASSIHDIIESVWEGMKVQPVWSWSKVEKRALETFLYAHCGDAILSLLAFITKKQDDDMEKRLEKLQFVKPAHLEVSFCEDRHDSYELSLSAAIHALESLEAHHSPGQILACVLDIYKCAIGACISAQCKSGADDLLPTLILVVIRSSPKNLIQCLRFVEVFATQDQLRGEAGYAFTSLLSAVHFLQQLDFDYMSGFADQISEESTSLLIRPACFRAFVEHNEQRRPPTSLNDHIKEKSRSALLPFDVVISASQVRSARLNGNLTSLSSANSLTKKRLVPKSVHLNFNKTKTQGITPYVLKPGCLNTSVVCYYLSRTEMNNFGVQLFLEGRPETAVQMFQNAQQRIEADMHMPENICIMQKYASSQLSSDLEPIRAQLSCLKDRMDQVEIAPDIYVYQRDVYDEGMGTFSYPILVDCHEEQQKEDMTATVFFNMAVVSIHQKKFKEAFVFLFSALREGCPGERLVMAILSNIGHVLYLMGHFADSEIAFTSALKFAAMLQDGADIFQPVLKSCIACVRWRILQSSTGVSISKKHDAKDDILALHMEALRGKREVFGSSHLSVAVSWNQIGCVYGKEDQEKALESLLKCLKIRRAQLPDDHPDVLQVLYNIAVIHHTGGTLTEALELYCKCLCGMKKVLGDGHRDVSSTLICMAMIHRDQNQMSKALDCCREALACGKAAFGMSYEKNEQMGLIFELLGSIYQLKRDVNSAVTAYKECVRVYVGACGKNHVRVGLSLISLGNMQKLAEEYDDAIRSYQLALSILRADNCKNAFDIASALNSLGYIYALKGELMNAIKACAEAVNMRSGDTDERHLVYGFAFHSLGVIFTKLGKDGIGKEALRESEKIYKDTTEKCAGSGPVFLENKNPSFMHAVESLDAALTFKNKLPCGNAVTSRKERNDKGRPKQKKIKKGKPTQANYLNSPDLIGKANEPQAESWVESEKVLEYFFRALDNVRGGKILKQEPAPHITTIRTIAQQC